MNTIELKDRQALANDKKLAGIYTQLRILLSELNKKEIPNQVIESINGEIEELNETTISGKDFMKLVKDKQTKILKLVEQDLKYVPKNHFRNIWLALGMAAFGVPLGVAFGLSIGNMAMLAIGIPIGMVVGLAVGTGMDKKAAEEGRQLDIELKY
ncbi:hypothetical protein G3O08_02530 [Cryomorpha ignava]|uniref:Uncharacterized protein n=1 Tax=Cryomorpha ignava TaxID=101383 RepID=A0A7K3WL57_9FLAO|nr:hypothetical protein [Cryomorpha ignava]NEN22377.1 hypothetical protein [Cryomorpha ignava]